MMMTEDEIRAKKAVLTKAVDDLGLGEWYPGIDTDLALMTGMVVALEGVLGEIPDA